MKKKHYVLEAVIEGRRINFNKEFDSRNDAMSYVFKYFASHGHEFMTINDEYYINNNKHNIEYVSDYENRFRIARA